MAAPIINGKSQDLCGIEQPTHYNSSYTEAIKIYIDQPQRDLKKGPGRVRRP